MPRVSVRQRPALLALAACLAQAITPMRAMANEHLEPGKQGETAPGEAQALPVPYAKGVRIVGHSAVDKRPGNLIMAWSGQCAYVADGVSFGPTGLVMRKAVTPTSGVAVIDVSKPSAPKVVRYLQDKGAINATETMHAVNAPDRAILAASTYAGVAGPDAPTGWLDVYDVSDCAAPKLLAEVAWPEAVHTLTVSPNGKRVYGTIISPFTGDGGIAVMDISDPSKPRFVGKFGVTRGDGTTFQFAPHEVSISPDERRIYAGVIASRGDDLNKGVKLIPPNAEGLGPDAGGIYILDNSDLAEGRSDPKLRLVGTALHAGWHSAVQAQIKGVPYLVGAGELGACPGAWPRITNIADERNPKAVGEFRLQMNYKQNCPPRDAIETATGGVVGRLGTAAAHFNDVDSATDTRLGLFPFLFGGLRIADLRDPKQPTEIAYFKPGDACGSHVRYQAKTGHIWLACSESGFWVLKLKPEVQATLRRQ